MFGSGDLKLPSLLSVALLGFVNPELWIHWRVQGFEVLLSPGCDANCNEMWLNQSCKLANLLVGDILARFQIQMLCLA